MDPSGAPSLTFLVVIETHLERRYLPSLALGKKEASSLPKSLAQSSHKHPYWATKNSWAYREPHTSGI